mmetsp:Transcript_62284/g.157396  ORF Transcript_62284/g.157396 Transcript_62284/m.157396 type:complete len:304 (+) Transcript_62284:1878-2789(+)
MRGRPRSRGRRMRELTCRRPRRNAPSVPPCCESSSASAWRKMMMMRVRRRRRRMRRPQRRDHWPRSSRKRRRRTTRRTTRQPLRGRRRRPSRRPLRRRRRRRRREPRKRPRPRRKRQMMTMTVMIGRSSPKKLIPRPRPRTRTKTMTKRRRTKMTKTRTRRAASPAAILTVLPVAPRTALRVTDRRFWSSWATSIPARPSCWTRSGKPMSRRARPAVSRSRLVPPSSQISRSWSKPRKWIRTLTSRCQASWSSTHPATNLSTTSASEALPSAIWRSLLSTSCTAWSPRPWSLWSCSSSASASS